MPKNPEMLPVIVECKNLPKNMVECWIRGDSVDHVIINQKNLWEMIHRLRKLLGENELRIEILQYAVPIDSLMGPESPNKVPLLSEYPEFSYLKLQYHYTVYGMWFAETDSATLQVAVDSWNAAAKDLDFMQIVSDPGHANIRLLPVPLRPGLLGEAFPLTDGTCVIVVADHLMNWAPLYEHEIGHCLNFAHNKKQKDSIMQPHDLSHSPKVDAVIGAEVRRLRKILLENRRELQ